MVLRNVFIAQGFDGFQMLRDYFPSVNEILDFKIVRSRKSRLGHMGKRKIANTVFLQLSFGMNDFFLKMYMWCCEMFLLRKVLMVFKMLRRFFPFRQ